ncbi:MAG: hypothetical protein IJM25_03625 [Eubacterium sp.]|nr:hypothetical protein [Eubacterium sp.]
MKKDKLSITLAIVIAVLVIVAGILIVIMTSRIREGGTVEVKADDMVNITATEYMPTITGSTDSTEATVGMDEETTAGAEGTTD